MGDGALGLTCDAVCDPDDYGPWWWLPTVNALKALCTSAGFTVEAGAYSWNGNAYTVQLLRSDQFPGGPDTACLRNG